MDGNPKRLSQVPCSLFEPQLYRKFRCKNCFHPVDSHRQNVSSENAGVKAFRRSGKGQIEIPGTSLSHQELAKNLPKSNGSEGFKNESRIEKTKIVQPTVPKRVTYCDWQQLLDPDRKKKFVLEIVQQVLETFNTQENGLKEILRCVSVNYQCKPEEINFPLSSEKQKHLENIKERLELLLLQEKQLKKLVLIQSVVRRWLVRRRFLSLSKKELASLREQHVVLRELVLSELRYIEGLTDIIEYFILKIRKGQLLKHDEVAAIFSNVEPICEVHKSFLGKFQGILDSNQWPLINGLGSIMLELAAVPILNTYETYMTNFKNSVDTVLRLQNENIKFNGVLQEAAEQGIELQVLLSLPVNHISSYERLFERMVAVTPLDNSEYPKISMALATIRETSSTLLLSLETSSSYARLLDVKRRLISIDGPLDLVQPNRVYIKEGEVQEVTILKRGLMSSTKIHPLRYLFLFNDVLYVSKPVRVDLFRVKQVIHITKELTAHEGPDLSSTRNLFEIKFGSDHNVKFFTRSPEERKSWIEHIHKAVGRRNANRVFGVPLKQILERDKRVDTGIPLVIEKCFACIDSQENLQTEGIFRIPGIASEIEQIKSKLGSGKLESVQLDFHNIHSVCSVVKAWFREMQEPLICSQLYHALLDIQRTGKDEDKAKNLIKVLKDGLPAENYKLLKYLVKCLTRVVANSEHNKMTPANLSIVFGPALIRPPSDTIIETTINLPVANAVVQTIIENQLLLN